MNVSGAADENGPRSESAPSPDGAATRNVLSGTVHGPSVQASAIHGGVHVAVHQRERAVMVPRTLPPRPPNFVNRRQEIDALDALHRRRRDGVTPVVVLTGPGGVGKTSVALEWLHTISDEFPRGQLYADLGGPGIGAAVPPDEVLGRFLRELGTDPRDVPYDPTEQASMFRSLTADQDIAVCLDNAVTAAQVRPLLPVSANGLVVVTSRYRLGGLVVDTGARLVSVDPLAPESSVELLSGILGAARVSADASSAGELARLCDGLPLALCVAGARLTLRPTWPVARAAAELSDERRRLPLLTVGEPGQEVSVQAVFAASYRDLPADAARLYRLLGLHPGSEFATGAAAAAAGVSDDTAATLLEVLVGASLVEEVAVDRYRLHDLLRLDARRRSDEVDPAEERDAAVRRMVEWYLRCCCGADLAVLPGRWRLGERFAEGGDRPAFATKESAWAWLEAERANLAAAVRAAAERSWDELVWQLCEALWGLLFLHKHYRDWIESHELGVAAAQHGGELRAEGRMRCQLGIAYHDVGRFDEAVRQFRAALDADRTAGHRRGEATALEWLGLVELRRERYDEAAEIFQRALPVAEEAGEPRAVALLWHHLGRALDGAGHHEEAFESLRRARIHLAGDTYNEARVSISIGHALVRLGRPEDAREPLNHALAVMSDEGIPFQQAIVLQLLGEAAAMTGDLRSAREHLQAALAVYDELGSPEADAVRSRLSELSR